MRNLGPWSTKELSPETRRRRPRHCLPGYISISSKNAAAGKGEESSTLEGGTRSRESACLALDVISCRTTAPFVFQRTSPSLQGWSMSTRAGRNDHVVRPEVMQNSRDIAIE